MTVAAQLRVAIALLIAALLAILLAAFYVPAQLQRSANEKYVEDAIPLRVLVQDLALQISRQQAAVEAFLRTRDPAQLQRYFARRGRSQHRPHADAARCSAATRECSRSSAGRPSRSASFRGPSTSRSRPFAPDGAATRRHGARTALSSGSRRPADQMIEETDAFVAEAEREQRERYGQLLFVLASLGVLALGIGVALFLRRSAASGPAVRSRAAVAARGRVARRSRSRARPRQRRGHPHRLPAAACASGIPPPRS